MVLKILTVVVFLVCAAMSCGIVACARMWGPAQGVPMHPCRQAAQPGATKECAENYDCPPYQNPSGPCEWVGPTIDVGKKRDAGDDAGESDAQ